MTQRQKIVICIAFIGMIHFLLVVLFGDNGLLELKHKHDTHQLLFKSNAEMTKTNLKMYRAIDRLQNDSAFIEDVARRELGMIRSDELIFKFKSHAKAP